MNDTAQRAFGDVFPTFEADRLRAMKTARADGIGRAGLRHLRSVIDQLRTANLARINLTLTGRRAP